MTTRTFKSVSGKPAVSSQSGTSAPTDTTERAKESPEKPTKPPIVDPVYPPGMPGILQRVSDDIRNMTPDEFRCLLKDAGIIENLTARYLTIYLR